MYDFPAAHGPWTFTTLLHFKATRIPRERSIRLTILSLTAAPPLVSVLRVPSNIVHLRPLPYLKQVLMLLLMKRAMMSARAGELDGTHFKIQYETTP